MKTFKLTIASMLVMFGVAVLGHAADEGAATFGFTSGLIGSYHTSTGTNRASDTRGIAVDATGGLKTLDSEEEMVLSTGTGFAGIFSVGNTSMTFIVNTSSWFGAVGCRNAGDNCNVIRLASQARKVYVRRIYWLTNVAGNGALTPGRTRVRLFDTQGSTGTNSTPLNMFFDQAQSSNTVIEVGHYCSSGTVLMKDSDASIMVQLGRQDK